MECGTPFDLKKTEEVVSLEPAEQFEQVEVEAEVQTFPEALQDETLLAEELTGEMSIFKSAWVKANGRCQCLKAHHGHDIPCGKELRVDAYKLAVEGGWVYCDLHSFPFDKSDDIAVPAIVCWECYNWKPDFNWEKFQSTHVT